MTKSVKSVNPLNQRSEISEQTRIFNYIYRYKLMRLIIPFLCLMLLAACHNKSDLKRIAELERENNMIIDSLVKQKKFIEIACDSLIKKEINSIHGCDGISFSRFTVFNKDVQYLKIGSNYYGNIYLGELHYGYENHFFKYSNPTKERKTVSDYKNLASHDRIDECSKFSFTPKDTGWYYWNGEMYLKNNRTGMVTTYPITDSFYVYK